MPVADKDLLFLKTAMKLGEIPKPEAQKVLDRLKNGEGDSSAGALSEEMGLVDNPTRLKIESAVERSMRKRNNRREQVKKEKKKKKKEAEEAKQDAPAKDDAAKSAPPASEEAPATHSKDEGKTDSSGDEPEPEAGEETREDKAAREATAELEAVADPPAPQRSLALPIAAAGAMMFGLAGVGIFAAVSGGGETKPTITASAAPTVEHPGGAFSHGDDDEDPEGSVSRVGRDPETVSAALNFALRMVQRMRDGEDESSALEILDDYLQSEGEDDAAVEARAELMQHCRQVMRSGADRVRKLQASGKKEEAKALLAKLRRRLPTQLHGPLTALVDSASTGGSMTREPPKESESPEPSASATATPKPKSPHVKTYLTLRRALEGNQNPDAHFQLGEWARDHDLPDDARICWERAVSLDAFHEGARKALGHQFHEGRWYSQDQYKEQVLGLVKAPDGSWKKPGDIAGVTREKDGKEGKDPKTPGGAARRLFPPPPPSPFQEDIEWYKDNESPVAFADAPVYTTKYYKIKTNVKPEYAKRYGKMMDRYFKRFLKVFKEFMPSGKYKKSEIWIYASREEFRAASGVGPTVGGFYSPGNKRVTAYHGMFGQGGTTRDVLAHEGTHQFEDLVLQGKFRNAPIWIIEGLAVYFESAYFDGKDIRVGLVPRQRLWALKRGLATNSLIPFRDLIRTPQSSFGGYHYAHAWALIYMVLYYSDNQKVRKATVQWFSDLFSESLTRRVTPQMVEERIGGRAKFKEFEEKWKAWIKDLPYDYDPKKG